MLREKISICFVFILLLTINLKAQENSPYTRFGVGNLFEGYPVDLAGSGGLIAASEGPTLLNYANPASYGSLQLTTFSTGVYVTDIQLSQLTPVAASQSFQNGSLTNLCLGFPVIKEHWGASFGLVPYSRQEYSVANLNSEDLGYTSYNSFDDSGSLYKFYIGNGVQIKLDSLDRINIGINASYLFGTYYQADDLAFVDTFNAYNTQHTETRTVGGVLFDGGLQYLKGFKSGARLVFGVQGNLQTAVAGHITNIWDRYIFNSSIGNNGFKDTILNENNVHGTMVIPASINVGLVYDDPEHFSVGVNYSNTNWNKFSSFGDTSGNLTDSWRIAVGGQWIPNSKNYHTYSNIIKYSAGFYFEQTGLQFGNGTTLINQVAVTLGASLPLTKGPIFTRFSSINFAVEAGERGTTANGLLQEKYITFSVGLTLNDLWFVKRKFE